MSIFGDESEQILLNRILIAVITFGGIIIAAILYVATRNLMVMTKAVSHNLKVGMDWFERVHKILVEIRDRQH